MKRFITATIIILTFVFVAPVSLVLAQSGGTVNSGQGLQLGPPVLSLTGDPGEIVKARVSLRDVTSQKLVVTNEINDFVPDGESGSPRILINTDETTPYSLIEWIKPIPPINLVPKQVQTFDLEVTIPANAAPGGYYGVIRFTGVPPDLDETGVSLSASVGALVLLKVNGDAKEEMQLSSFLTANDVADNADNDLPNWLFESLPVKFIERYKNTGNVHESPLGKITISDMFGNVLTEIKVNGDERNVLPGSTRKFQQVLKSEDVKGKFIFGLYTAKLESFYSSGVVPLQGTLTFWVLPWRLILAIIAALLVLVIVIRFIIRRYIQRTVGRTRGRRR